MGEQYFWFLAPGTEDTPAELAVSVPGFSEVQPRWVHDPEDFSEYLEAPRRIHLGNLHSYTRRPIR
jgi:hypothetical protein